MGIIAKSINEVSNIELHAYFITFAADYESDQTYKTSKRETLIFF